jgi:hypothetical protein
LRFKVRIQGVYQHTVCSNKVGFVNLLIPTHALLNLPNVRISKRDPPQVFLPPPPPLLYGQSTLTPDCYRDKILLCRGEIISFTFWMPLLLGSVSKSASLSKPLETRINLHTTICQNVVLSLPVAPHFSCFLLVERVLRTTFSSI